MFGSFTMTTPWNFFMGFQIQIWLPVMKQDIISYMSTVEDTRTKSVFIVHFRRHNNWIGKLIIYQLSYEILDIIMKIWPFITPIMTIIFSTCCPNSNTLICKLDTVYRYTVFNGKNSLWTFLQTFCTYIFLYIKSFCYIFYNIVENHP